MNALLPLAGVLLAGIVTVIVALVGRAKKQGAAEATGTATAEAQKKVDEVVLEQAQTEVKQVEQANEVRDRLDADPAYRQRVRDRFTRD